ncbi:MAG: GAF domain-containing protein [Candidatus Rokubacteria bacterium]|nr:GAF domain-containing protein [Candidatus Rokubacteria bacterium]
MKIGRVFPDLLTPLGAAASIDDGLARTLRRLVALTGARAGALVFRPPRDRRIVVTAGAKDAGLRAWLVARMDRVPARPRVGSVEMPGGRSGILLSVPLGAPRRPVGHLLLVAPARGARARGRRLARTTLPAGFPRELGAAIEQVWRLHRRTVRISVVNEIMSLLVSSDSLDDVFRGFAEGLARLVEFDSVTVALVDRDRDEIEVIDVVGRATPGAPAQDARMPIAGTFVADVLARGRSIRVDDVQAGTVPDASRRAFTAVGYRSALVVPLVSGGGTLGAVTLAAHAPAAFDDSDADVVAELARPLASAVDQRRLFAESRRSAEELGALYSTGQLITSRLDVASVLDRITRSVIELIGSTACSIGLLDAAGRAVVHTASRGVRTDEWRQLAIPVGDGIIGACAASGAAVRVGDVVLDPRSARRDIDEQEGIRSMLCVPLRVAGAIIGVLSAFSTRPGAFTAHHQRLLEAFADQAGTAIANARLFEESERRGRETRALLEAGRAVTATLDGEATMRVIMEQAKAVLGVASCGIMIRDPATSELVNVASLDLPPSLVGRIRLKEGEGVTGLAVAERRPVQSPDLWAEERGAARYGALRRETGFRSMLAVPLREGDRAVGALVVFRLDVHEFTPAEEELLLALADQAAIALEHARLYERLEEVVEDRTRELDAEKRFVEVVLETLPLGVFVLAADLRVLRVNREGGRVLPADAGAGAPFARLLGDRAGAIDAFLDDVRATRRVQRTEEELAIAGEMRIVRLTAAPLEGAGAAGMHVIVLAEDITLAKRLERQMLLTERLTTAGRLAAGVAHELNNPLATIAGCAESLVGRLGEASVADADVEADFRRYLGIIEEEAFRCKEITGSLLHFVREPGSRRTPTDMNALVTKTIELLSHQSRFADSTFVTELAPDLPRLTVNEGQLRQVFLGLASNALEAMDGRGRLTLRTRLVRDELEIELEDEGPGIPDEVLPRIFDPFFTTKPPGQGTGLGLAIAQGIVADHGGRIEATSRSGKGSVFRVVLPR